MAKFYVQSGTLRAVVDSVDMDRAALWAVHQVMEQIAPLGGEVSDAGPSHSEGPTCSGIMNSDRFLALGESIALSETGFDRDDAVHVDTFAAFREWHDLWHAIERLENYL